MKRQAGFELLRILAMLGVVIGHFYTCGLQIYNEGPGGFSLAVSGVSSGLLWSVMELLKLVTLVSVNCYILITGYFLIDHQEFRWRSMFRVWFQMWVYGVGLYVLMNLCQSKPVTLHGLFVSATPLLHKAYWFITAYLILLLAAPVLSRLAACLSKRNYLILLAVGFVFVFQYPFGHYWIQHLMIPLFFYLYLVGGAIRKFLPQQLPSRKVLVAAFVVMLLMMFAFCIYKNIHLQHSRFLIYAMEYNGAVLPLSVVTFLLFRGFKIPQCLEAPILYVAPLSLAVYLIHEHSSVNYLLWGFVQDSYRQLPLWSLPLYVIGLSVLIFAVSVVVETLRRHISLHFKLF